MKPDDQLLALWVEDELEVSLHPEVEAWASGQDEWRQRRDQARVNRDLMDGVLGASEEVPHAEFFNARIRREIMVHESRIPAPSNRSSSRGWFLPLTAAAGLAVGILIGRGGPRGDVEPIPQPMAELAPVIYTPEHGVEAEYFASKEATVILLAGVEAIPDSWEIPETAMLEPELNHTASAGR